MSKRDAILERVADFVLTKGWMPRPFAQWQRGRDGAVEAPLYYFKNKDGIETQALNHLAMRRTTALEGRKSPEELCKEGLHNALYAVVLSADI